MLEKIAEYVTLGYFTLVMIGLFLDDSEIKGGKLVPVLISCVLFVAWAITIFKRWFPA